MKCEKKYFGTDGIRGRVGGELINPALVLKLGWAAGKVLGGNGRGKVLVGKDTRLSGYMLESALEAGLTAAGMDTHLLGPMPTPAIAYLTRALRAKAGIVISASHNAYQDNGIKFFDHEGKKLPDELELAIEAEIEKPMTLVSSNRLGRAKRIKDAPGRYIEFCKGTIPFGMNFSGMRFVIDCAHGATYHIAPNVFRELGADVVELATRPNGMNINQRCGATYTHDLQKAVVDAEADLGIAFDGDGDRVIMVDAKGEVVDGDEMLFIMAKDYLERGCLGGGVVGTVMSNFGFEMALKAMNIPFQRASVGDRYVLQSLQKAGWILGGEASGHIVNLNLTTTGDGIVSALQVLQAIDRLQKPLHELKSELTKFPQSLINVTTAQPNDFIVDVPLQKIVAEVEKSLGEHGRVLLRASGTEPVIRVMVEGKDKSQVEKFAQQIANEIK